MPHSQKILPKRVIRATEKGTQIQIEHSGNHHYLKQVINNESQFARRVRELVRLLWAGDIEQHEFYAAMRDLILHGYEAAWREGQDEIGNLEFLPVYESMIRKEAYRDVSFLFGFAIYIADHDRTAGGSLSSLQNRTNLWINGYNKIKNFALWQIGTEIRLIWERHSKDGCSSCTALDGKIYTASEWRELGLRPQHPQLACVKSAGGIPVCRCTLLVTERPRSSGALPAGLTIWG